MKQKIIITAANGFLGNALVNHFKEKYQVIALARKQISNSENVRYLLWDGRTLGEWHTEFEGALAVINLAGRSVDCRYNEKNKHEIYVSRLESTQIISDAIKECKVKPEVWLNSASATIYRHSGDKPMTEKDGEIGTGFSVDVCQQWEKKFYQNKIESVRQIALRTAIVLGKKGGVMIPFMNLVKLFLGGKLGNGNQQFSWIHIDDFCKSVEFLIDNKISNGSYNVSSPNPITNKYFMSVLRKNLNRPFGIPSPKWLLELGAKIIKTETELILKSRYVIPERLINEGFQFTFPKIENAIDEIINN
jgi:uncharacterized protein (TIGR01777 family)